MPQNLAAGNSTNKAAIRDCEISPLILQSPPNVKAQETHMKLGALIVFVFTLSLFLIWMTEARGCLLSKTVFP
jgi:hypothetical protein